MRGHKLKQLHNPFTFVPYIIKLKFFNFFFFTFLQLISVVFYD